VGKKADTNRILMFEGKSWLARAPTAGLGRSREPTGGVLPPLAEA
jgi:hypothetical protein